MLRYVTITALFMSHLGAIPFYWEAKTEEPGFTIDVPSLWTQASRARDKVANVHFERTDRAGRVAIEVRSYSSEGADLEQLVLQLRTRLAVKYDRVYLLKRKEVAFRKNIEKQVWSARVGKKSYLLTTAFVISEDKILQLICVTPANRKKEYEIVFDNALLSLDFSDGKPESGGSSENSSSTSGASASSGESKPAAAVPADASGATPAAPATATKPKPKIEF